MARGNTIIVGADARGVFSEGIISGTPKPGTVLEIKASAALVGGRHTYQVYQPGTDGFRREIIVLLDDPLQGILPSTAYVDGTRCFVYKPMMGDQLNMLLADVAGTGDDHAIGETLIVKNATGKLIATTGSPQSEPFRLLETITDPVADTLAWCEYTGY